MVLNNDLAPTILELARAAPPVPMDGRSLTPVLQDTTLAWRRRFLIEHRANDPRAPLDLPDFAAVRTASLLWVEHGEGSGPREFYDLSVDPYQLTSLHADTSSPRIFQKGALAQMLEGLRTCGNGSCQTMEFHTYK
jgi:arylsulfatase A-like enzyme